MCACVVAAVSCWLTLGGKKTPTKSLESACVLMLRVLAAQHHGESMQRKWRSNGENLGNGGKLLILNLPTRSPSGGLSLKTDSWKNSKLSVCFCFFLVSCQVVDTFTPCPQPDHLQHTPCPTGWKIKATLVTGNILLGRLTLQSHTTESASEGDQRRNVRR